VEPLLSAVWHRVSDFTVLGISKEKKKALSAKSAARLPF
jgi:hypothetical protein